MRLRPTYQGGARDFSASGLFAIGDPRGLCLGCFRRRLSQVSFQTSTGSGRWGHAHVCSLAGALSRTIPSRRMRRTSLKSGAFCAATGVANAIVSARATTVRCIGGPEEKRPRLDSRPGGLVGLTAIHYRAIARAFRVTRRFRASLQVRATDSPRCHFHP